MNDTRTVSTLTRLATILCVVLLSGAVGCFRDSVSGEDYREAQRERQTAQERIQRLENKLENAQETEESLRDRLARTSGLTEETLAALPLPVKIQLASQSGGYDHDDQPGDDGIVLYIQPVDEDGHVVKAAGKMTVELYDLAAGPDGQKINTCRFDTAELRASWYGRLMTQHFTLRCPWPEGYTPEHREITARASFTELLSGRTMTLQETFEISMPLR